MREMKKSGIEWIGEIPKDWKLERLQWHLDEIVEKNDPIVTTQVLSLTNKKGVIPYEEKGAQGNVAKESYDGYKIAYPNTIVANSMNILIGSVGYSNYYGCVSPVYYVFKEKENNDLRFINYIMQTSQFQKELRRYANGILEIRLRVSSGNILKRICAFPEHNEQSRIADYLDSKCFQIDVIIEKQQAIIEKLKEYKLSLISEAVTKGLNKKAELQDSQSDFIGKVPVHWQIMKFGRCITVKSNLVPPDKYKSYPQVSPDSIEKSSARLIGFKTVEESGVISWNHLFYKGQIIYSKIRPLLDKVIIAPFDGLCSADMYPIETTHNPKFIVYMILSAYFHSQVALVTENRVKMPKINQNELSNILVAVPPINEQEIITEWLDRKCELIDKTIRERELLIEQYNEYKKSLIYEVVTGKKEV